MPLGYRPPIGGYDEMAAPDGTLRPAWRSLIGSSMFRTPDAMGFLWQDAERQIRENGVTYNVYGDPRGLARPWPLDPVPLVIGPEEWQGLEAGLIQRARLLNALIADIYGPQSLLRGGVLPPGTVFGNPGFLRPCHGTVPGNGTCLYFVAVDLGRQTDGSWTVLDDRTQAPSGAGYALENRMVLSHCLSEAITAQPVERLAQFFRTLRENLSVAAGAAARRSRGSAGEPRVVLLTPGPYNETYFEHAYLARYLGYPLVAGEDLTVRYDRVYLKTLAGLQPVDGILRRLDDDFCDPLWLKPGSALGITGLVSAVRRGNVAVFNMLGSGVAEAQALRPYLPQAARALLGEELLLPQARSWWLGDDAALREIGDRLDSYAIRPAFATLPDARNASPRKEEGGLRERLGHDAAAYTAREEFQLSSAPVWLDGKLTPRPVTMRAFIACDGDSWTVMPGGLTRVARTQSGPVVSLQQGGGSKDTWVIANHPVEAVTLWPDAKEPIPIRRTATADLPSRVADNLFWLGRYTERAEITLRAARGVLNRYLPDAASGAAAVPALLGILESFGVPIQMPPIPTKITVGLDSGLPLVLARLHATATMVRDRLSMDAFRILNRFNAIPKLVGRTPASAAAEIEVMMQRLAAFNGLAMENMTRGLGWRFLELGRRIERAGHTISAIRTLASTTGPDEAACIEALLEICDSTMTYRARYYTGFTPDAVLDLVLADETNPRAVAFQLAAINEHVRHLPRDRTGGSLTTLEHRMATACLAELRRSDMNRLGFAVDGTRPELNRFVSTLSKDLAALSDALSETYFKHAVPALLDHGPSALTARR